MEKQTEFVDSSTKRLSEQHRQKIALLEKQALQQKQQLLRGQSIDNRLCVAVVTSCFDQLLCYIFALSN